MAIHMTDEAIITINGWLLSNAESMTVRCAIESFAEFLVTAELGDDEHGKTMVEGYLGGIRVIRRLIRASRAEEAKW